MGNKSEKTFQIVGEIRLRKTKQQFKKKIKAKSEKQAIHKVYSLFGSHNGLKRSLIKINEIKVIA